MIGQDLPPDIDKIEAKVPARVDGCVGVPCEKRNSFLSVSLCLSRACLGKMIVLYIKMAQKVVFFAPSATICLHAGRYTVLDVALFASNTTPHVERLLALKAGGHWQPQVAGSDPATEQTAWCRAMDLSPANGMPAAPGPDEQGVIHTVGRAANRAVVAPAAPVLAL
jgi:hypothetical protein